MHGSHRVKHVSITSERTTEAGLDMNIVIISFCDFVISPYLCNQPISVQKKYFFLYIKKRKEFELLGVQPCWLTLQQ